MSTDVSLLQTAEPIQISFTVKHLICIEKFIKYFMIGLTCLSSAPRGISCIVKVDPISSLKKKTHFVMVETNN